MMPAKERFGQGFIAKLTKSDSSVPLVTAPPPSPMTDMELNNYTDDEFLFLEEICRVPKLQPCIMQPVILQSWVATIA
jgi:hypothetical protein